MKYQFNFAFDDRLIEKFDNKLINQTILVIRAVMDAITSLVGEMTKLCFSAVKDLPGPEIRV